MIVKNFQALSRGLCEVVGMDVPDLIADENGIVTLAMRLHDVDISIGIDPQRSSSCAFVLVSFGALPEQDREAVLCNLLEANLFMLNDRGRAFSFDPGAASITLQYACPCADAVAADVYQDLLRDVSLARQWRTDYSIDTGRLGAGASADGSEIVIGQAMASLLAAGRVFDPSSGAL